MTTFTVGQEVTVTHPNLGGTVNGVILFNDLKGPVPVLIKTTVNGDEICLQVAADGSGFVKPRTNTADSDVWVSYLFADGTATRFAKTEDANALRGTRTAIGAMKAKRRADRTFYDYNFVSFEEGKDSAAKAEAESASIGALDMSDDKLPSKDDMKEFFDRLFGRKGM